MKEKQIISSQPSRRTHPLPIRIMPSWLVIAPDSDFSISNIPFGVFSHENDKRQRCGTRIGAFVLDLSIVADAGLFDDVFPEARHVFAQRTLNALMGHARPVWVAVRNRIIQLLDGTRTELESNRRLRAAAIHSSEHVTMHLPATIGDYTDFYSSRNHAENVGTMFRGKDNALQPNWLHLPVGYHGRSSTVVVSGQDICRPCGQVQNDSNNNDVTTTQGSSIYAPCRQLDFELEVAFFVGGPENPMGRALTIDQAHDRIFGYVLMNDWSARDIQKWEYVPLGPFTAKNFATTISPWVITTMALEACPPAATLPPQQPQEPEPLAYLQDHSRRTCYNVHLSVSIQGDSMAEPFQVAESNISDLYWTPAQQLAHHSVTGCTMKAGDLLGSGTISSKTEGGSMLELSWKGTKEVQLGDSGQVRKFLQDGDTVIMRGWAQGESRIGFGSCVGKILAVNEEDAPSPPVPVERYTDLNLYNFGRSSASWRVRIVLESKSIPYDSIAVDLQSEANHAAEYADHINLMKQVPVLELKDHGKLVRISQSIAIVEFLEEAFPTKTPLLPVDAIDRARARQVCQIVNSGIQPLQNVSYLQDLQERSEGRLQAANEARRCIHKGLVALEALLGAGVQPCGDGDDTNVPCFALGGFSPSLADAVLVPQLFNAKSVYGMDLEAEFPTLHRILQTCLGHSWFAKTHPNVCVV